jgi:hypothetical protein
MILAAAFTFQEGNQHSTKLPGRTRHATCDVHCGMSFLDLRAFALELAFPLELAVALELAVG